jgi:hypothetical protein
MMSRVKIFNENRIALLALILSILSSIAAVYQWWSSGRDEKIHAAIDMSERYIAQGIGMDLLSRRTASGQEDTKFLKQEQTLLEYTAFLANRGLLDWRYLAQGVTCDIAGFSDSVGPEATQFNKAHPEACAQKSKSDSESDEKDDDSAQSK